MRAHVLGSGFTEATPGSPAEVVVINTCTVTARADQEARQLIRRIHREAPGARIVVTGCYAQRAPNEVSEIPGVAAVLGSGERDDAGHLLRAIGGRPAGAGAAASVTAGCARSIRHFRTGPPVLVGRTRALLKIQDGCDSFCAYCIVPYVRGRSRSLPLAEAVERGRRLIDTGFHEIVLTGADLGSYGHDLADPHLLARLIEALLGLGDRHRIRLSSIEPNKLDPGIADLIGSEPRLCRHLHLPLQSGSNAVLRAMRRGYTREGYRALLERVTARGPVGIGADVIVGFPGEDDEMFEETRRFLEEAPVTFLHVFRYSPRPGTAAARFGPPARDGRSRERSETLRALGEAKGEAFRRSLVGSMIPVVPESGRGERGPIAMSDLYVPVELTGEPSGRGVVPVRILGVERKRLIGSP